MSVLPPRIYFSSNRNLPRKVLTEPTQPCKVEKRKQEFSGLSPEQLTKYIYPSNLRQIYIKISDDVHGKIQQKGLKMKDGSVCSGPFEVLVEWAITPENTVFDFSKELLLNYKSYCSPMKLLSILDKQCSEIQQTGEAEQSSKKKWTKVTIFMKNWTELLPEDFAGEELSAMFEQFVRKYSTQFVGVTKIKSMVDNAKQMKSLPVFDCLKITDKTSKALPVQQLSIDYIVGQITLYEFELFVSIKPNEFLGSGWTKKDKYNRSKNLCDLLDHFNAVTNWVSSSIISVDDINQRAELISKFIDVAVSMLDHLNFTGFFEFYSGLVSANVSRLTKTWEMVKNVDQRMKPLRELAEPTKSYAAYRNHIKQNITQPSIPFLGVIIQDLTFIDEGNPDSTPDDHVNFEKCRLMAKQLIVIKTLQQKHFPTAKAENTFYDFITTLEAHKNDNEKELYESSLKIQPRTS
ncbi:Guanine nucleotide exchange factor [Entamoeba marina]